MASAPYRLTLRSASLRSAAFALLAVGSVAADEVTANRPVREAFVVETDGTAEKKLATVAEYANQGRWDAAIGLLRDVAGESPNAVVRVAPDRSLAVPRYCDVLLSRFPAEGLAAYRRDVDPRAAAAVAEADATGDDRPLRLVAGAMPLSSSGDDALWRLGERAWERGDIDAARRLWTQLVPLGPAAGRLPPVVLRYPDTDLDLAAVRARLVLCSVASGDGRRAAGELEAFRSLHPDAAGPLAGRDGNYVETLAAVLATATGGRTDAASPDAWDALPSVAATRTFGAATARSGVVRPRPEAAVPVWSRRLGVSPYAVPSERTALRDPGPLSRYPVAWRDKAFVADADRVYAFDLASGRPAWPAGEEDVGVLYPPAAGEADAVPTGPLTGTPRHTLTVDGDRLYARLGPPVTAWPTRELRNAESEIVCLDLAREGTLAWRVGSGELAGEGERWAFEGPPVADGQRLYLLATRSRPQAQLNALCLDAATGAVLWNRVVGAPIAAPPEGLAVMTHRLAAAAGGRVYLSTGHGAVVCLDADEGRPVWVGWYESAAPTGAAVNDPRRTAPEVCLVAGGVVVAAPSDSDRLFAFDAASGVRLWERTLRGGGRELVGAADGVLVASGERLRGLDLFTGRELWSAGFEDPPGFGAGRGLIAGGEVYWPTREDLLVVEADSGRTVRRVPLKAVYGLAGGGNLAAAEDRLLLATPDGIVAFGEP